MTTEIIRYAVDEDGIATLTLDYPGKTMNVIDLAFMDNLEACIARVVARPGCREAGCYGKRRQPRSSNVRP